MLRPLAFSGLFLLVVGCDRDDVSSCDTDGACGASGGSSSSSPGSTSCNGAECSETESSGCSTDACRDDERSRCGPTRASVARVFDGDTIELDTGERVRYLLVDTPELKPPAGCYAQEARAFNRQLVEGREITLRYDVACEDTYGRLLAYVEIDGRSVNELLLERGFACTLIIPPNGQDERDHYEALEDQARAGQVGMWGSCDVIDCE